MKRILEYWIPPSLLHGDAETRRRAQLLARCVIVMCVIYPVMTVVYSVRGHWILGSIVLGIGLLHPLTLVILKYGKSLTWSAHTLCFLLWSTFVGIAAVTGGTNAPILSSNAGLLVLATILGGVRGGRIWTGIVLVTLFTTLARTKLSLGVTQLLGPDALLEFRTAEPAAVTCVLFALCVIYERLKDQMLRAVESERSRAEASHRDTKLILDNTGQGFVTLDARGSVVGEMSAIAQRWFPGLRSGVEFAYAIEQVDAEVASSFRIAWQQLIEGILPLELNLEQMPSRLSAGHEHYAIEYRVVLGEAEQIDKVVVILSNITAQRAQERAEAEQRELLAVFRRILADSDGVSEFLDEGSAMVARVVQRDAETRRHLHTLKGNAGLMGLTQFAELCHELEDRLASSDTGLTGEQRAALELAWGQLVARIRPFVGAHEHSGVVLDKPIYEAFLRRLTDGEAHASLARDVRLWGFESLHARFERFGAQACALGKRLNKGELQVIIDDGGMRLDSRAWGPFWAAFVHVVRNAVDHGLESPEERAGAGKPALPTLAIKAYEEGAALVIEVADDGRGVAWDAIAARAEASGLAHASQADLVAALFAEGITSRDEVTEVSGRGVGLAAVKQACDALGGTIEVHSRPRRGTQFMFKFPLAKVDAGALQRAA